MAFGCGGAAVTPDAGGPADAGVDAGNIDAGAPDAGSLLEPRWETTADTPVATGLWGVVMTYDPVGKRFIMHGGNTYPTAAVISDTYAFSLATKSWEKLTTQGDAPPLRYCHCATYLPDQKQVLIVGGRDASSVVTSAYTLDLATLTWSKISGLTPTRAIGCVAHWMPQQTRAIVFSGEGVGGVSAKLFAYDPVARSFAEVTLDEPPARRDAMSMFLPSPERVLVYGGAVSVAAKTHLDDLVVFDGTSWTSPMLDPARPSPRRYGASGYDPAHGRWLLYGGTNDVEDFDDLWLVDPLTYSFTRSTANAPGTRAFAASEVDPATGDLYVFGGLETQGFTAQHDGWVLHLDRR